MKKCISFEIIIGLIILITGVCGCTMNSSGLPNNTESEVSLSQRQKDILREQGLSTEYSELYKSQQRAIVVIEDMLCYAEEKYNTSFSYAGYSPVSSLEKEHMRAFPTSGDKQLDSFTITKTDDGYEDDYMNVVVNEVFVTYLYDGIKSFAPNTEVKVFAKITETSLVEAPTAETDFEGKVESSLCIFVDKSTFNAKDLSDFKMNFSEFMNEHKLYGKVQIILLEDGKIAYPTRYNYVDYLSEKYYVCRESLYFNK